MPSLQRVEDPAAVGELLPAPQAPWVIVLAGRGEEAVRGGLRRLAVQGPPPQFRTFVGSRSVIRHAADRARRLAPSDRIVTVIDSRDRVAFEKAAGAEYPGAVLFEPRCRGTAPELFRALTYVLAHDSDAVVVVLPANHFVFPEGRFLCAAADAVQLAERFEDRVILLGQVPDGAEMDYSWIEPERPSPGSRPGAAGKQPLPIRRLHDRPATAETELLYHQGSLLNTKVLSARGKALWSLGERHLAAVVRPFAALRTMLGGRLTSLHSGDAEALSKLFDAIPEADLHRDLLGRSQRSVLVLRMAYVQWSDWARTRRVRQTLERFGRYPMQPLGIV